MIKFKKITAVLLSLVMAVTTLTALSVTASAASEREEKAVAIILNKKVSVPTNKSTNYYKFTIKEETDVWLEYTAYTSGLDFEIYNSKNQRYVYNSKDISLGTYNLSYVIKGKWDEEKEKAQGRLRYTLDPGEYYLEVYRADDSGTGKISFTLNAPVDESPEIDYISMTVEEGTKITLGAVLTTNSKKSVKWSSSNKTVASITSKGVLTAKAEGTTTITGKVGDSTVKIKVKVK